MMMPYPLRQQQELPAVQTGAPQLIYNSLPNTPIYGNSPYPLDQQIPHRQGLTHSNRPLFRNHSTSSLVPTQHSLHENMLRRKTPSGTLPAAYDGVDYVSRPTKQILVPYHGEESQPGNHGGQGMRQGMGQGMNWADKTMGQASNPLHQTGMDMGNGNAGMFSNEWPSQHNGQISLDDNLDPYVRQLLLQQQQQQQTVPPFPDSLWMNSQFSGFQPMYNPIQPPTASCDEVNAFIMGGNYIPHDQIWYGQQQQPAWGNGQTTPTAQLPQAVDNMNLNAQYDSSAGILNSSSNTWLDQFSPAPVSASQGFYPAPLSHESHLHSAALDHFPTRLPQRNTIPGPSREKVAAWAHKAYVDLLASIHSQQRQADQGHPAASVAKNGMYPRPPRLSGLRSSSRPRIQSSVSSPRYTNQVNVDGTDRRKRLRASIGGNAGYPNIGTSSSHSVPMGSAYPFSNHNVLQAHHGNAQIKGSAEQFHVSGARKYAAACSRTGHERRLSNGISNSSPLAMNSSGSSPVSLGGVNVSSASTQAVAASEAIEKMCGDSDWNWVDGMLLAGCLAYGLGDLNRALAWYRRVLDVDEGHVEALSNCAATLLSLYRKDEAERYWRRAIEKQPSFFQAVEHLVGLLCGDHRAKDAVEIINYVEMALRRPDHPTERNLSLSSSSSDGSVAAVAPDMKFDYEDMDHEYIFGGKRQEVTRTAPCTNGFMIPGSDNGRIIALIHAKGNMLYTLGDNVGAAKAFEDAVLLSAGIQSGGIQSLINKILVVLKAATERVNLSELSPNPPQTPVLLPPDKAIQTARLVFPPDGSLPGLRDISNTAALKAAISTTSNSLLSLAKIFQDGMSSGGATAGRPGANVKDILALYYLSLSLHASPSTANNVGILLASLQQGSSAPVLPGKNPHGGHSNGVGLALLYYYYGLNLDNRHAHLYTNLGSLLKDINHLPTAIKMYEQAVACDPSFDIALANLANAVKDQGRIKEAIEYYRRAVKANPDFAEAVCGLATALNSVCDWKGRGGVVRDGGNRDRWHVDDGGMLRDAKAVGAVSSGWMDRVVGIVEKQLLQGESWGKNSLPGDMLSHFVRDIAYAEHGYLDDNRNTSLQRIVAGWAGRAYEGAKVIRLIERASRQAVWRWYQDKYVKGINKPRTAYRRPMVPPTLTTPSAPTVLPFHTFTCPLSAKEVRLISERNGLRISCSTLRSAWLAPHIYPPPAPPAPYLRVGYVSSDFNNHPLAHLMQSVFGLHDQTRVKAYCYATSVSDNSEHRKQIEAESPVFYDAHTWGPDRLVQKIVEDGIHILINLNGFTRGARNEVFAARPAPIQMGFMGFAGTLGAEWCDYLYADTTAVPPGMLRKSRRNVDVDDAIQGISEDADNDWVYSENIIFARYTFFCCDHRQSAPDSQLQRLGWDDEVKRRWKMRKDIFPQLEDDRIILGNFNQLYKVEPTTFRTWLRILAAVPKAVLWLLRFPDIGEANLLSLAESWASKEVASRIIFTDVAPKPLHISRAQVCDLFLDTPECNAHTTAADVLWSGTPLLTLPRHKHKMCSRIAASILRAAVPQTDEGRAIANGLVATSEDDYERRAIELAAGMAYRIGGEGEYAGELGDIRKVLFTNRWTSELFNTKRWVSDLEDAYEEAWRKWVKGEGGDIDLKALKPGGRY